MKYCVLLYINIGQNGQQISSDSLLAVERCGTLLCVHLFTNAAAVAFHENTFNPSNLDISNVMKIDYLLNYCWVSMLRHCCFQCPAMNRVMGGNRDSHEQDLNHYLNHSLCFPADVTWNLRGCLQINHVNTVFTLLQTEKFDLPSGV